MRAAVNLATEPFRRDRPVYIASGAIALLLLITLGVLLSLIAMERRNTKEGRQELVKTNRRLAIIAAEQKKIDADLKKPENSDVLERSVFLNTLLRRKGISWTRMLADLEKVVPYNVRVISVRPQVNARNHIFLEMTVGADSPEPVLNEFMKKLETSNVFGSNTVYGMYPPSQTDPLYRYRLSVNYVQKF